MSPYGLIDLNSWSPGTGTKEVWPCRSGCSLVGGSVSLEVDFGVSKAQARLCLIDCLSVCLSLSLSLSLFVLPVDSEVELSKLLQHHVCLHAAMFPIMKIMD